MLILRLEASCLPGKEREMTLFSFACWVELAPIASLRAGRLVGMWHRKMPELLT